MVFYLLPNKPGTSRCPKYILRFIHTDHSDFFTLKPNSPIHSQKRIHTHRWATLGLVPCPGAHGYVTYNLDRSILKLLLF